MSSVLRSSRALGIGLASALAACGGNGATDLFTPSSGTGSCGVANCSGPSGAGGAVAGAGGGSGVSATTGQGAGGTSSGAAGGGTSAGGGGSATGGAATGGGPGTGGSGAPMDSGAGPVVDATASDGRLADALGERNVCVPTGVDFCDGLDNDCNGSIDDRGCPDGCVGIARDGVGYLLCYGPNQQRTWLDSETQCTNRNMHLARIDDAQLNSWIRAQALAVNFTGIIWIGASDSASEGNWIWTDGTQFWRGLANGQPVNGLFNDWDMGEPNSAGVEDCAAMWLNTEAWHDAPCTNTDAFICQGP